MKTLTTFILALSFSSLALATDIKVTVKGMVCAFCAQGITKKFKARPEVNDIDVSLEKKLVSLKLKDGKDIPDQDIRTILTQSGYTVEKIERN